MYKVMIVDDEDLIRDDLAHLISSDSTNLDLVYSAFDGLDALEHISEYMPDLVITDIRMPEIDGLELIERAKELYPNIIFIILSGYSDFDYAQKAIKFGVKDYLLKPVSEEDLHQCIEHSIITMKKIKDKEKEQMLLQNKYEAIKNIASEKFFRELLEGKNFGLNSWKYYQRLTRSQLYNQGQIFVCFLVYSNVDLYHLFALQNITHEIINSKNIIIDSKFNTYYIAILDSECLFLLEKKLKEIKETYFSFFNNDLTIHYSFFEDIETLSSIYKNQIDLMNQYYFWLKNKITTQDTIYPPIQNFTFDLTPLSIAIKTNNSIRVKSIIKEYLDQLYKLIYHPQQIRFHHQELLNAIFAPIDEEEKNTAISTLMLLSDKEQHQAFTNRLYEFIDERVIRNNKFLTLRYSAITNRIIDIIHSAYSNSALSLKYIATDLLYLNSDYIGKKFKQETSYHFNEYLMYYRIETAKLLIQNNPSVTVKELAEKVGFGINRSHFSRSFKKLTHMSPSDYSKMGYSIPRDTTE